MATTITQSSLDQFTGSENWYRHWTNKLIYTDGIHYLAENGAGWLVDVVASYQLDPKLKQDEDLRYFQIWELRKDKEGKGATVTCRADDGKPLVVEQKIEFTDFPLDYIKLYVERGEHMTLMLPSER